MSALIDCMEEHGIESHGYDKSVVSCPYYEIAEALLMALARGEQLLSSLLIIKGFKSSVDEGEIVASLVEIRAAVAQATEYPK